MSASTITEAAAADDYEREWIEGYIAARRDNCPAREFKNTFDPESAKWLGYQGYLNALEVAREVMREKAA